MALKTINGVVRGPDGAPFVGATITAKLSQAVTLSGTDEVVPIMIRATSAAGGAYTLTLHANNDMAPTGTFYTINESDPAGAFNNVFTIVVPQGAGPYAMPAIMTGVAPTASPQAGRFSTLTVDGAATFTAGPVTLAASGFTVVGSIGSFIIEATGNNVDLTRAGANYLTATNAAGILQLGAGGRLNDIVLSSGGTITLNQGVTVAGGNGVTASGGFNATAGSYLYNGVNVLDVNGTVVRINQGASAGGVSIPTTNLTVGQKIAATNAVIIGQGFSTPSIQHFYNANDSRFLISSNTQNDFGLTNYDYGAIGVGSAAGPGQGWGVISAGGSTINAAEKGLYFFTGVTGASIPPKMTLRASGILELARGNTNMPPTNQGAIRVLDNGDTTASVGGYEIQTSIAGVGYGWRTIAPDLGGGNFPYTWQVRSNSVAWTNLATLSASGQLTVSSGLTVSAGNSTFIGGTLTQRGAGSSGATVNADFQGNDTLSKFRIYDNGDVVGQRGLAFWGHAIVASQPAAPVTLADVIAIIRGCGLSA